MTAMPFWDHLLSLLEQKRGGPVRILKTTPVGGGSINSAYHLETDQGAFFVKTTQQAPPAFYQMEARGLSLLGQAKAQVPRVVAVSDSLLIMEWIPRGSWTAERMRDLGRQLAQVHQFKGKVYGLEEDNFIGILPQSNRPSTDWVSFYRDQRLGAQFELALQRKRIAPTSPRAKGLYRLLERLERWLPADPPPSLLHGDLWSGNVLPSSGGGHYLIDPAVYYGHREVDIAFSQYFGGFGEAFYEGYKEAYPLEPDYEERKPLYQLYYILVHLNLFGEAYGSDVDLILRRYVGK